MRDDIVELELPHQRAKTMEPGSPSPPSPSPTFRQHPHAFSSLDQQLLTKSRTFQLVSKRRDNTLIRIRYC